MSITRGVLAQSSEPEAHDKVLDNNNPDRIGIWKCWFLRRGENRRTRTKTSRTRTNNKLNAHLTPSPGIEPGPHWWETCSPHGMVVGEMVFMFIRAVVLAQISSCGLEILQ